MKDNNEEFERVQNKLTRGEDITDEENDLFFEVQQKDKSDIVNYIMKNYKDKYGFKFHGFLEELEREFRKQASRNY